VEEKGEAMKITFTGKQDKLTPAQERKLALAFHSLSKHVDRRGEKAVQVAFDTQRHLQRAEVRLNFFDQALVAQGTGADQFTAVMEAVDKVEKQALKSRSKWRDTKRGDSIRRAETVEVPEAPAVKPKRAKKDKSPKPAKVVRAGGKANGKPMTIEEAMLAIEDDRDYVVYRDAQTDKISVLVRRRDGKVDLIEA
jgi:putative sigma-54 modulation protein